MVFIATASTAFGQFAWLGRWEGSLELAEGAMPFGLSIVEGGALLDLPGARLFGYPSREAHLSANAIVVSFAFGGGVMTLAGEVSGERVEGSFRQGDGGTSPGGAFTMSRSAAQPDAALAFAFSGDDGAVLSGTLMPPAAVSTKKPPLVILHPGLGAADRNGNNYNVPGRNDALRQLAEALSGRGIASYRYDKRGSGAGSWLVAREEEQSFEAWIRDLVSAAGALARTGRYSGIWLLGLNDGAVVAAAAANTLAASGSPVAGLVVACASAEGTLDAFSRAVERAPEENRAEGEDILAALKAGQAVPSVSEFYAAAFRPSLQPYLIEAFRRDIETELARFQGLCLLVQGNMDMQATFADFLALQAARPDASTAMPTHMNHVLKDVSQDVEDNRASFSEPAYPLSTEFVDALVSFIAGRPE